MSIYAHIDALNEKHRSLSTEIKDAYRHHDSDAHLKELKLKRLRIEEEIERFYGMATTPTPKTADKHAAA